MSRNGVRHPRAGRTHTIRRPSFAAGSDGSMTRYSATGSAMPFSVRDPRGRKRYRTSVRVSARTVSVTSSSPGASRGNRREPRCLTAEPTGPSLVSARLRLRGRPPRHRPRALPPSSQQRSSSARHSPDLPTERRRRSCRPRSDLGALVFERPISRDHLRYRARRAPSPGDVAATLDVVESSRAGPRTGSRSSTCAELSGVSPQGPLRSARGRPDAGSGDDIRSNEPDPGAVLASAT